MNIFFLSLLAYECALLHSDKHCVKMILESAQLLWCAWHNALTKNQPPSCIKIYKETHKKHPMALWTRQSKHNFKWLSSLAIELCKEYTKRFSCKGHKIHDNKFIFYECEKCPKKIHLSYEGILWLSKNIPKVDVPDYKEEQYFAIINIPKKCTKVPLCMPKEYYSEDLIEAYRKYYKEGKKDINKWKFKFLYE
jgi:hypothetical protein